MRLRDLIEQLQDYATEYGDDIDVRLAAQPRWPFEYEIGRLAVTTDDEDDDDDDDDDDDEPAARPNHDTRDREGHDEPESAPVLYIGEGQQLGYLSGAAAGALGWKDR